VNKTAVNEKNMNRKLKAILLSAGLCSLPSLCFSAVVYDNTATDLNLRYSPPTPTSEFGDEISLAGTDRTLSQFQFSYFFTGATVSAQTWTLRFYANDGTTNSPGTVLYNGDPRPVTLSGFNTETITFPLSSNLVTVPDTFTWTVQFSNLAAGESGDLLVYGPPNVGSSFNDFWQKDAGAWSTMLINGASRSDFTARINAVPEPGVLALGGLGALLLAGLRRFRKAPR
jgi:hypothetical protein